MAFQVTAQWTVWGTFWLPRCPHVDCRESDECCSVELRVKSPWGKGLGKCARRWARSRIPVHCFHNKSVLWFEWQEWPCQGEEVETALPDGTDIRIVFLCLSNCWAKNPRTKWKFWVSDAGEWGVESYTWVFTRFWCLLAKYKWLMGQIFP